MYVFHQISCQFSPRSPFWILVSWYCQMLFIWTLSVVSFMSIFIQIKLCRRCFFFTEWNYCNCCSPNPYPRLLNCFKRITWSRVSKALSNTGYYLEFLPLSHRYPGQIIHQSNQSQICANFGYEFRPRRTETIYFLC